MVARVITLSYPKVFPNVLGLITEHDRLPTNGVEVVG